jgi:hypothetical protein
MYGCRGWCSASYDVQNDCSQREVTTWTLIHPKSEDWAGVRTDQIGDIGRHQCALSTSYFVRHLEATFKPMMTLLETAGIACAEMPRLMSSLAYHIVGHDYKQVLKFPVKPCVRVWEITRGKLMHAAMTIDPADLAPFFARTEGTHQGVIVFGPNPSFQLLVFHIAVITSSEKVHTQIRKIQGLSPSSTGSLNVLGVNYECACAVHQYMSVKKVVVQHPLSKLQLLLLASANHHCFNDINVNVQLRASPKTPPVPPADPGATGTPYTNTSAGTDGLYRTLTTAKAVVNGDRAVKTTYLETLFPKFFLEEERGHSLSVVLGGHADIVSFLLHTVETGVRAHL